MRRLLFIFYLSLFTFHLSLLTSCTQRVENPVALDRLPDIYPDYIGVTIPAEIAPLNFNLQSSM